MSLDAHVAALRAAFSRRELTLYLGAGVSVASGLPNWDRLVLTMYLAALGDRKGGDNPLEGWRVFPNYLQAIAEWLLRTNVDPAEITAQKIREMVSDDADFVQLLTETLYAPSRGSGPAENATLRAVQSVGAAGGVRAMVSYNYDDLVERDSPRFVAVWEGGPSRTDDKIPVFHVHGYLPPHGGGSTYAKLILTEEQFHAAASDPYSWSNLVQMRQFGSNVGLMVGMSLSDRNLRRILSAMQKLPDLCPQYAILKKERRDVSPDVLEEIERSAETYARFRKTQPKGRREIRAIITKLEEFDQQMKQSVLEKLAVQVLWIDDYSQIPQLFERIRE